MLYKAEPIGKLRTTENNFSIVQIIGTSKVNPFVVIERNPITSLDVGEQKEITDKYKIKAELKKLKHSFVELEENSGINYFRVLNIKDVPAIFRG